jgi:hypothetical protein
LIEDKTERPPFWHNWGDRGKNHRWCWTLSQTMTSRMP